MHTIYEIENDIAHQMAACQEDSPNPEAYPGLL